MPSLLPSQQELLFLSDSINEALDLYGQHVTLFPRAIYSKYLDNITLDRGTSLKILLQTKELPSLFRLVLTLNLNNPNFPVQCRNLALLSGPHSDTMHTRMCFFPYFLTY